MNNNLEDVLQLQEFLCYLRKRFEKSWSLDTAHHSVYTMPKSVPLSTGQCFVTSWVLKEKLSEALAVENIIVCGGSLWHNQKKIIDNHCWIETSLMTKGFIIDLTQDQASKNKVYIREIHDTNRDGFFYEKRKIYIPEINIKQEAMVRVERLIERMGEQ